MSTIDMSEEFLTLPTMEFLERLDANRDAEEIIIRIRWISVDVAKRLKAFVQGRRMGHKRIAEITCTVSQRIEAGNAFSSGVTWVDSEKTK